MDRVDEVVLFEVVDQHIGLVTLNRPAKRNAINGEVAQRLDAIVKQTEADGRIWAVVIKAAEGPTFCAGADLAEVAAGRADELSTSDGGFAGFVEAKRIKPWIAAVKGSALGGGLEISLACDMRIVSDSTVMGLPEVKRGLIAGAGGIYRLPLQIPRAVALEMIATGTPVEAARAAELGLVNRVVPADEVVDAALDLARAICANAPVAVRESLQVARAAADVTENESISATREAFARLEKTEDYAEGPRAFVEKRSPQWKGC